jgi:hypothetical protein
MKTYANILKFKNKLIITSLIVLLCTPVLSHAAPRITAVSGTVVERQVIIITGNGFGTIGPNIILFDDFEKGTNGTNITIAYESAQINNWSSIQANCSGNDARYPVYTSEWAHSGSKSMKSDWATSLNCQEPAILSRLNFPSSDEVFYSFWTTVPLGKNVPGDKTNGKNPIGPNWKLSWIFNAPFGNEHMNDYVSVVVLQENLGTGYTGWLYFDDLVPRREGGGEIGDHMKKGEWSRFDIYQKGGVTNGILQGHEINDSRGRVQKVNKNNVFTLEDGYGWNSLTMPGYGRGYTQNGVTLYDDVYLATGPGARARVEIGNASTYARSSNLAISTVSSWSDNQVTATIRQGSFAAGQQAYLYVVDSNGEVNSNGYPIAVGQP